MKLMGSGSGQRGWKLELSLAVCLVGLLLGLYGVSKVEGIKSRLVHELKAERSYPPRLGPKYETVVKDLNAYRFFKVGPFRMPEMDTPKELQWFIEGIDSQEIEYRAAVFDDTQAQGLQLRQYHQGIVPLRVEGEKARSYFGLSYLPKSEASQLEVYVAVAVQGAPIQLPMGIGIFEHVPLTFQELLTAALNKIEFCLSLLMFFFSLVLAVFHRGLGIRS